MFCARKRVQLNDMTDAREAGRPVPAPGLVHYLRSMPTRDIGSRVRRAIISHNDRTDPIRYPLQYRRERSLFVERRHEYRHARAPGRLLPIHAVLDKDCP